MQYTEAMGAVCKNAAHIASKKREAQDEEYMIEFDTNANIPKPHALLARLIVRRSVITWIYTSVKTFLKNLMTEFNADLGVVIYRQ